MEESREPYITARPVKFAIILSVEIDDIDGTAAVMLDDFVTRVIGTTSNDPALLTGLIIFDANRILTYIFKPDKVEGARTIAMNTLSLVLSDDSVLQCGSRSKQEDSILITWL